MPWTFIHACLAGKWLLKSAENLLTPDYWTQVLSSSASWLMFESLALVVEPHFDLQLSTKRYNYPWSTHSWYMAIRPHFSSLSMGYWKRICWQLLSSPSQTGRKSRAWLQVTESGAFIVGQEDRTSTQHQCKERQRWLWHCWWLLPWFRYGALPYSLPLSWLPRGEGAPLFFLYRDVPLDRVWFSDIPVLRQGAIHIPGLSGKSSK